MTIAIGMLLDRDGFCRRSTAVAGNHPGRTFDVRNVHTLEAIRLRPVQRPVGIDLGHDHSRRVGELVHLEEDGRGSTWAVIAAQPRSNGGRMVRDEQGRPVGPLEIRAGGRAIGVR